MINLLWLILLPIVIATISLLLSLKLSRLLTIVLQIALVAMAGINFVYVRVNGEVLQNIGEWPDYIGIMLRADLFACVMVLLTTLLFLAMYLYDLRKTYISNLFLFLFTILEGFIIGILLSNDLFNIFVLVEVSTITISILIMIKKDRQSIYDGMLYLLTNVVAMSFFLFGVGILYKTLGVLDLDGIKSAVASLDNNSSIILPYAFIITGVCLKSALMPLFSWLPKAHGTPSAPSSISAILSGLYVKSGIYLFIRINEAFSSQINVAQLFLILGFITAIAGFVMAIAQQDMKLILAYHTVSQIGLIMMGINMNQTVAYWGGLYHILNHAVFKSTLFLTAGMIIEEYKTRDVYEIRGVFRRMPLVSIATIFAILGITGAPLFNGSISKYFIAYGFKGTWIEYGLMIINLGTILSFVKYSQIFFGKDTGQKSKTDPVSTGVVLVLGSVCFVSGIFGEYLIGALFGVNLQVDFLLYLNKVRIFLITSLVAIILYLVLIKKNNIFSKLNMLELSFNGICLMITMFFGFILTYLKFMS